VFVPAGPTGMDPSQISFFHALQISTKINKGQIEITKDYQVNKALFKKICGFNSRNKKL
jgi:large subunit ribosomal protein LP0